MPEVLLTVGVVILTVFLGRVFTLYLHLAGAVTAALCLLEGDVEVYVGSWYPGERTIRAFRIGRLEVSFKQGLYLWRGGVNPNGKQKTTFRRGLWFLLAGPLVSLVLFVVCLCFFSKIKEMSYLPLLFLFLGISAGIDLILSLHRNLWGLPRYLSGQHGQRLHRYLRRKQFAKGIAYFWEVKSLLNDRSERLCLYFGAILHMQHRPFDRRALDLFEEMQTKYELSADEYSAYGLAFQYAENYNKAYAMYSKSLELEANNTISLNNRGYLQTITGNYAGAIVDLDHCLNVGGSSAFPHNNRGLARLKLGDRQGAWEDFQQSLKLNPRNPYIYRNLGIYEQEQGNLAKAKELLLKAKNMDPYTQGIDRLLAGLESA